MVNLDRPVSLVTLRSCRSGGLGFRTRRTLPRDAGNIPGRTIRFVGSRSPDGRVRSQTRSRDPPGVAIPDHRRSAQALNKTAFGTPMARPCHAVMPVTIILGAGWPGIPARYWACASREAMPSTRRKASSANGGIKSVATAESVAAASSGH